MGASTWSRWRETNDQSNIEVGHAKEELIGRRVGMNKRKRKQQMEMRGQINLVIILKKG